jgi:acetyltransferase-like isoleucine patch superfamily enzyme
MVLILKSFKLIKRIRNRVWAICIRGGFHKFGTNSVICIPFRSENESYISIGKEVFVGPGSWIEVIDKRSNVYSPVIIIEDNVSISGDCTITAVSHVKIGNGALIARFVHISDHSHGTEDSSIPIMSQGLTKILPVSIGAGAWLGHGAVICPGVTVGRNAVIGANSVVRDDVPDGCVAVGAPARIVRRPGQTTSL